MQRFARRQKAPGPPHESVPTRVAVAASKSSKRVGTARRSSRKSISGGEALDAFSDALQRQEPKRPASAAPSGRGGRVAAGLPSPPKGTRDGKESDAEAAGRVDPEEKRRHQVEDDGAREENDSEQQEDDDGDASGLFGVFVQTKRCETLCHELGMTTRDVRRLKRKFDDNDMYNTGEITQAEFFFMIDETRRPLTVGILSFARVPRDAKYLSFDQYVLCIASFATLTKPELYQYVFDLYDADRSGSLDEREFARLSRELQSPQFSFPANVQTAIRMLGGQDGARYRGQSEDGLVDFDQFMKFARHFPVAFYPIINMQKNVRAATLGESYWSRLVARKLRVHEVVTYMRSHDGAVPLLTVREQLESFFSRDVSAIRQRAGQLYALEMAQRRKLGWQ